MMIRKEQPMLETAIVGGGLCGLALMRSLIRQDLNVALFEARSRIGGRVLSVTSASSDTAIDLGPGWFWPDRQPLITQLVAELGLPHFPQHDQGTLLHLHDCDKTPDAIEDKSVHNGARRLEGGMSRLIDALAGNLPGERLHLNHVLVGLRDGGDHVVLTFRIGNDVAEFKARRVVLALPPRLLEEQIRFEPDLDDATRTAMRSAGTWMAAQAKVAILYEKPFWREAGQSGNAFVSHDQAVIGEIFDACDNTAKHGVLGGFLAFSLELRQSFSAGLPMLMASQMAQVFGRALEQGGEQHYQDWATEPFTCSALDRNEPSAEHFDFSNPLLRRALWDGRLYLGGSETASHGAGYLEGALDAARRIARELGRAVSVAGEGAPHAAEHLPADASIHAVSLARFRTWVDTQRDAAFDGYRQRLNRDLASQQKTQLTQRAILESVEEVYRNALDIVDSLVFDMSDVAVERGRSALTPELQQPFRDFMQTLLDDVVAFNRTSCALSNFPEEHHVSKDYMQAILRDIAAAWQEFSLSLNRLLLAKAGLMPISGGHPVQETRIQP